VHGITRLAKQSAGNWETRGRKILPCIWGDEFAGFFFAKAIIKYANQRDIEKSSLLRIAEIEL
jgi:hypothetical protein